MKIKTLILKNYRRFANLEIPFESSNANNTTVFIGNNGARKMAQTLLQKRYMKKSVCLSINAI